MIAKISPAKMAAYKATARQRRYEHKQQLALRYQHAWQVARQASQILKEDFGATRVVAFGSILSTKRFHQHSDIDLAVWDLPERLYYRAVAHLLDLDTAISIDLVEADAAAPALRSIIEQEGVTL